MENKDFDKFIRDGLENHPSGHESHDWDHMEQMLDEDERQGKELLYIKGIELVLVFLVVLTMIRFYPSDLAVKKPMAVVEDNVVITPVIPNGQTPATTQEKTIEKAVAPTNLNSIVKENAPQQIRIANTVQNLNNNTVSQQANPIDNIPTPKPYTISPNPVESIQSLDIHEPSNLEVKEVNVEPIHEKTNSEKVIRSPWVELSQMTNVASDELDDTEYAKHLKTIRSGVSFRMGLFVGYDWNHIMTPFDKQVGVAHETSASGFSAGVTTSILKGNWEIETGLRYSRKSYHPLSIYEITGSTDDGYEALTLDKLTFNIASLPINTKYFFPRTNKWKFYASVGGAFNVVAWSDYNRHKIKVVGSRNPNQVVEDDRLVKKLSVRNAGVFFGETLKNNYYVTANVGLGVERRLDEKTSFFVQPSFSYYLMPSNNGLGPNKDRFNTLSVDMGMKFDF